MSLELFHPVVESWFRASLGEPTEAQVLGWPSIKKGVHTLIAAPTGSGKTLAAFMASLDGLVREGLQNGSLPDRTEVLYISPLKALSNDIEKNLQLPLQGIQEELRARGLGGVEIRTAVRTGDTPQKARQAMVKRPPHICVTTPESVYLLLTSPGGRAMLSTVRTVIVDEIHALVQDKRGAHLALSLERLDRLVGQRVVRVGLSATQDPIAEVARFLTGGQDSCTIVDVGHVRKRDVAIEIPDSPLEAVMSLEVWKEVYARIVELIQAHKTTLVFVNTRRMAERVAKALSEQLGSEIVACHHGSLSKEIRLDAEQRLKHGALRVLVATASLELGIDIGDVNLVAQLGSPRQISGFLQRVGRSGHTVGGTPKGRLFPLSIDELVECTALLDAVRRAELDRVEVPKAPLDILAQQMVAEIACQDWSEDELYQLVRQAYPFSSLTRATFDAVVRMLTDGITTRQGRANRYVHYDGVHKQLKARRNARLTAITCGGAIPDNADYEVLLEPSGGLVGTVNEDFAIESLAGDIFQLGNTSWRILRVESGKLRVQDAKGQPPTIPFWLGEAPGRSDELSFAVARLHQILAERFENPNLPDGDALWYLVEQVGLSEAVALQVVGYLQTAHAALGALPTQTTVVAERFFDESGNQHVVIHSPFGDRVHRAWGLALRKRFCRTFNFELQAAATDNAMILSLGPTHSFPLEDVFRFLHSNTARAVLIQALLDAPMFGTRWRWNAARALAVRRFRQGRKVPPRLQRMEAEDLLAVVFPDQLACQENLVGERTIPDHPLVEQTLKDCLEEAMDADGLERVLRKIESGEIQCLARDGTEPSPLAQGILNARPYAFLDDAPLEERRTRAVMSRRWLDMDTATTLGSLDPQAIACVREQAWSTPADAEELHDALVLTGYWTEAEAKPYAEPLAALVQQNRVAQVQNPQPLWIAAERANEWRAVLETQNYAKIIPSIQVVEKIDIDPADATREIMRSRLESVGPVTASSLSQSSGLTHSAVEQALVALQAEGFAMRGTYTQGAVEQEWCERRLLARIHRYTLERLRKEIEPVPLATFMRFLFAWQHVDPAYRVRGMDGLHAVLEQLEGFSAAAGAWEHELLPLRVEGYDFSELDRLSTRGRWLWMRALGKTNLNQGASVLRTTPIAWVARQRVGVWTNQRVESRIESSLAQHVYALLKIRGAAFFDELVSGTGLLKSQVQEALSELVALGEITCDSFAGLRALLTPESKSAGRKRRLGVDVEDAGRWSVVSAPAHNPQESVELIAATLLRRYGVVFRGLLERESLPPWRDLLRVYRRMEMAGEVRGGRFVDGPHGTWGEHFALPDALGLLRTLRKTPTEGSLVRISGDDPLNLTGTLLPGRKVASLASHRILFRDGVPIATMEASEVFWLTHVDEQDMWTLRKILERRPSMDKHKQPSAQTLSRNTIAA